MIFNITNTLFISLFNGCDVKNIVVLNTHIVGLTWAISFLFGFSILLCSFEVKYFDGKSLPIAFSI